MILPMSVFFLALAVLGGFIILLSRTNTHAAGRLPWAFSMLFAGVGYCGLALPLYPLAFYMGNVLGFALLFFAPFIAALSGAILGHRAGLKRVATPRG